MRALSAWHLALAALGFLACSRAPGTDTTLGDSPDRRLGWTDVFTGRDADNGGALVRIAADTVGSRRLDDGGYLLWIETRHSRPRLDGGRPFDRELLRFVLRCATPGDGAYRQVSVTLLNGDRPPVYQRAISVDSAQATPWILAKPGTFDLAAFTRACALITHQAAH